MSIAKPQCAFKVGDRVIAQDFNAMLEPVIGHISSINLPLYYVRTSPDTWDMPFVVGELKHYSKLAEALK